MMLSMGPRAPWHFYVSFLASSYVRDAQEQRKAKMARYTPASAPYEELQAARAQRLEVCCLFHCRIHCCCVVAAVDGRSGYQP